MARIQKLWSYFIAAVCIVVLLQFNWKQQKCVDRGMHKPKDTVLDHPAVQKTSHSFITPIQQVGNGRTWIDNGGKLMGNGGKHMENGAIDAKLSEYHDKRKEDYATWLEMSGKYVGKGFKWMENSDKQMGNYNNIASHNQPEQQPKRKLKLCPKTLASDNTDLHYHQSPSGLWSPSQCRARHVVAVIVPYKDRQRHLQAFLEFMPPFLQRQWLAYQIMIIEQKSPSIFNRGYLLNIGLTEAQKLVPGIGCVIFHDVDLIPENNTIKYSCHQEPFHLAAYVNSSNYRPTPGITGGVFSITPRQMQQVNGYSNIYWGWGGEDADLYNRLSAQGIRVVRGEPNETRYKMLPHGKDQHNPVIRKRFASQLTDWTEDGLNSLNYSISSVNYFLSHTHIDVSINVDEGTGIWLKEKYKKSGHS